MSTLRAVRKGRAVLIGEFTIEGGTNGKVPERSHAGAGERRRATTLTNDNWEDTQATEIAATGLSPDRPNDSAIVADLEPGSYRAIVRGNKNKRGRAVLEVYNLP